MFYLMQGSDQLKQTEEKTKLLKKYISDDDFNFVEYNGQVAISDLNSSMKQAPMFAEYFVILLHLTKKQFTKLKDYLRPTEFTVLIVICDDFLLTNEQIEELKVDSVIDCKPLGFRDLVKWIKTETNKYGFSLELEDRKKLALMFASSKELSDILYQMSLLNAFERREFFNDLFKTKQEFVWDLFIALCNGNQKEFFKKYADQYHVNVDLSKSQFNMKLIGGLLFCLKRWSDSPEWILSKLTILGENGEKIIPFLYSHLIEVLIVARKEQSNIPVLMKFVSILKQIQEL